MSDVKKDAAITKGTRSIPINPYNVAVLFIAIFFFQYDFLKAYFFHTGLLGFPSSRVHVTPQIDVLVPELSGCTGIKLYPTSAAPELAFLACSADVQNRKNWYPSILNRADYKAVPKNQDVLHVVELKTGKAKPLIPRQFNGLLNVGRLDVFVPQDNPRHVFLQVINYYPVNVTGLEPRRSSIEIFSHKIGTAEINHIRTITDNRILTPTDILATGPSTFFILNQRPDSQFARFWDDITRGLMHGAGTILYHNSNGTFSVVGKDIMSPTSLSWATFPELTSNGSLIRRLYVSTGCDGKLLEYQTEYSYIHSLQKHNTQTLSIELDDYQSNVISFEPTMRVIGRLHYCILDMAIAPAPLESTRIRREEQRRKAGLSKDLDVFDAVGDPGDIIIFVTGTKTFQPVFGSEHLLRPGAHTRITRLIPNRSEQREYGKFWDRDIIYESGNDSGIEVGPGAIAIDEKRNSIYVGSFVDRGVVRISGIEMHGIPDDSLL